MAGINGGAVLGFDMVAALALADALGVPRAAVAELLPVIESEMVAAMNKTTEETGVRGDWDG